jgi:hypothetical protein
MNQGPRGDCLTKKTRGKKSHDTVPLKVDLAVSYQTAEDASAVSIRLLKPLPRSLSDCGSRFGGLYQTVEAKSKVFMSASAVSIRPLKLLPRSDIAIHFQQSSRFS